MRPLGAQAAEGGWSFAVYSKNATRVLLEIYDAPTGSPASRETWMTRGEGDVWHALVDGVEVGAFYAYRAWGPNFEWDPAWRRGNSAAGFKADVDAQGNRFNPNKVLYDPYAHELSGDREPPEMLAAGQNGWMYFSGEASRDLDTGLWSPKAITVVPPRAGESRPAFPEEDTVIYEVHLRGLTMHPSSSKLESLLGQVPGFEGVKSVPEAKRGTYAGAAFMAPYLRALGYTAIELLPVHELANPRNYWGYMTYGFFAPNRRYAHDRSPGGPTREFREMVKAFHAEGLKVYLDVVYNHTGEEGIVSTPDVAEILGFRGLDNASYYALRTDKSLYWDTTGCGNNLDASSPAVQALILESLRYWSENLGVDGFRFDLAEVLGETGADRSYDPQGTLLTAIRELGAELGFDIIAEPWSATAGAVAFPPGWAAWNGRYRDAVRDFCRGAGNVFAFVSALNGSFDNFSVSGGPQKSVNFLTAHDGFTLVDLVSYNAKNNSVAWPFGPSDGGTGGDDNRSWDSGGDTTVRRQRMRSFVAIQFVSRGVPLSVGGDELGRTQNGNNNPYQIDSMGTWMNYESAATHAPDRVPGGYHDNCGEDSAPGRVNSQFAFLRFMAKLRAEHKALRQARYADFAIDSGDDVTYLFTREDGTSAFAGNERCVHLHIDGSEVGDRDFLVFVNMFVDKVAFTVKAPVGLKVWRRIVDTAAWAEPEGNVWTRGDIIAGSYDVNAWSVVVLEEVDPVLP